MKRRIIISLILTIFLGITLFSYFNVEFSKSDKKNIEKEISNLKEEIEKSKNDSKNYEEEVSKLKEESISKLEELEIWKKAEKRLEQAQ